MTTHRTGAGFLALGVICFLAGGAAVLLRSLGVAAPAQEVTTSLAVAGLMAVAIGAGLRRQR